MPLRERTAFSLRFQQQLDHVRSRIEMLPEGQREHFRSLADQAEQHHVSMERDCATVLDLVDDMRLDEASAKFGLWAAAEKMRRLFASAGSR